MTELETALTARLTELAEELQPPAESILQESARRRLLSVARWAPCHFALLVEPWRDELLPGSPAWRTVIRCAELHMYARVLDDAVDENLPCHRRALLACQPALWRAVAGLAILHPERQEDCAILIGETVGAVMAEDAGLPGASSGRHWGAKNHHLLLAPMLLDGDGRRFGACREALSRAIALIQAQEEFWQGTAGHAILIDLVRNTLEDGVTDTLAGHGWLSLSWALCEKGAHLLNALEEAGNGQS